MAVSPLLASALISLVVGRRMDRYGAGKTMKVASFVGAASPGVAATSWNAVVLAIKLDGLARMILLGGAVLTSTRLR